MQRPRHAAASVVAMVRVSAELAGNSDRLRWNAKYAAGFGAAFAAHPVAVDVLSMRLPPGPMLELACGLSGGVLLAAAAGRPVVAVDASDVALGLLEAEASSRGLGDLVTLVHADLVKWHPEPAGYALVVCTGYWDRAVFPGAVDAVMPGGSLGWEALTIAARRERPSLPEDWCVRDGEPASLLPASWEVNAQYEPQSGNGSTRRLLATRRSA